MNPQISIIIPIYNSSSTLERCVNSILRQDFPDFEVLLVDDGSKDDSLSVAKKLKLKDDRIRVFHKENGGVSSARNLALDYTKGEYVCFIDSDDYVEPNYLSAMYVHRDCDMVVCGYYVDWLDANGVLKHQDVVFLPQQGKFDITQGCDCIFELFVNGKIHINCNKLLKRSIIEDNHIRYTPIPVNEDYMFMIEYLKHAKNLYATPEVTYHWLHVENVRTGVDSIPANLIDIYLEAQSHTYPLFNDPSLVDQVFYFTYEIVARKYMIAANQSVISKKECLSQLKRMFGASGVKKAWSSHRSTTKGEWLSRVLLKYQFFKLYQKIFLK